MQPQQGLPPHPVLPVRPLPINHSSNASAQRQAINVGALAAQALTSSLANPYGQSHAYPSYTNANYHAYFTQGPRPMTSAQGYTLSSTFVPITEGFSTPPSHSWPHSQRGRTPNVHSTSRTSRSYTEASFSAPGDTKCTYDGCSFTGSKKTVEIHRMDRHLIFPPGWKKKTNDWDTDPALKGKPVPIQGTGLTLDTPEAIDAWIAERKKRWPSKQHVQDKKRKAQEAADRGEIDPSELTSNKNRKRRKVDGDSLNTGGRDRGRWRGRRQGGRGRGIIDQQYKQPDSGWRGRGQSGVNTPVARTSSLPSSVSRVHKGLEKGTTTSSSEDDAISKSDSDSDMDPIKDAVSSKTCDPDFGLQVVKDRLDPEDQPTNNVGDLPVASTTTDRSMTVRRAIRRRKPVPQPRSLPQNPFATRPSLLRNLLLPEIRHTVSNLSQAIHFLVENDFMEGVELNPGDADSQRIKVLESSFTDVSNDTRE